MDRLLLFIAGLLLFSPTVSSAAECASSSDCAALQLWSEAGTVSVEITSSKINSALTTISASRSDGEEFFFFQQSNHPGTKILIIPGVASLFSGMPASATCDSAIDAPAFVRSHISIPLNYLARAIPGGPSSLKISEARSWQVTVAPGRMYVDPGNFIEIKRPLTIAVAYNSPRSDKLLFDIAERADTTSNSDSTHYSVSWSKSLIASVPASDQPLSEWLVCASPGVDLAEKKVIGELRKLRANPAVQGTLSDKAAQRP